MGGNACKEWGVGRLNADAYYLAEHGVLDFLRRNFPTVRFDAVNAYTTKKTFGDMDIVYSCSDGTDVVEGVKKIYAPRGFKRNGDCFSWVCETLGGPFQVDLIHVAPEEHDFAFNYFNYNDLGGLLGRVYHEAGFKLGHKGLRYVVRDPSNAGRVVDELVVTLSWHEAMSLMDYNHYWCTHFNTPEDLFRFTMSSSYSSREVYLLENLNAKARFRDRKRPAYTTFLRWLDANPECGANFDWGHKDELRERFLAQARVLFPKFGREYKESMVRLERMKLFRSKFNGALVQEWTGLEGKELGAFMSCFRKAHETDLEAFVLTHSIEDVEAAVKKFHEESC